MYKVNYPGKVEEFSTLREARIRAVELLNSVTRPDYVEIRNQKGTLLPI